MTTAFHRPRNAAEALALLAAPGAASSQAGAAPGNAGAAPGATPRLALGGGTQLNSLESRDLVYEAVFLEGILPRGLEREGDSLSIGALTSFQDLVESPAAPEVLRAAARGMVDRNIRNRATVGGNLGADKSCSSLVPILLALGAELLLLDGRRLSLEDWLGTAPGPSGRPVLAKVLLRVEGKRLAGYARWSRVSCDLAVLGAAAVYSLEAGGPRDLRLVLGGVAPRARRHRALETALEGRPLPSREELETLVLGADASGRPFLSPIDDARASADFKRLRMAALVAEALLGASPPGGATDRSNQENPR